MLSPRSALRVIKSRGERLRLLSCLLLCAELLRNQLQQLLLVRLCGGSDRSEHE